MNPMTLLRWAASIAAVVIMLVLVTSMCKWVWRAASGAITPSTPATASTLVAPGTLPASTTPAPTSAPTAVVSDNTAQTLMTTLCTGVDPDSKVLAIRFAAKRINRTNQDGIVRTIASAINDPNDAVRAAAKQALKDLGATSAPFLAELLESNDEGTRAAAVECLYDMGSPSFKPMVAKLGTLVGEPRKEVMARVVQLAKDPATRTVMRTVLEDASVDPDARIAFAAAEALSKL